METDGADISRFHYKNTMKKILIFIILICGCISAQGQTYSVEFESYGVDSFFIHETEIHVEGGIKHSHTTSVEFSDTSQLTQFIEDVYRRYLNIDAEANRLRDEADKMLARHDSLVAGRAIESLSIRPFEPTLQPSVQPRLKVTNPMQKPEAVKPKKRKQKRN